MKRRIFKLARRVVLFLLLGAILDVAVAWAANWVPKSHDRLTDSNRTVGWPCRVPASWPQKCRFLSAATFSYSVERYSISVTDESAPSYRIFDYDIDVHRSGWPMRCLTAEYWNEAESFQNARTYRVDGLPPPTVWRSGIPTENGWGFIPIRPIWPGFAINTVFYAAILWLLFAFPGALRRSRRIKRGLCPACGYDLRGGSTGGHAACPECGKAVTGFPPPRE